jgi:hypothetical protein
MERQNQFLFLYPIGEYFDIEIQNGSFSYTQSVLLPNSDEFLRRLESAQSESEKKEIRAEARVARAENYRLIYSEVLNSCIDLRYRAKDFVINFAVFDDKSPSDIVSIKSGDRIIKVGLSFKEHTTKRKDGTYPYPDQDYILDQISPLNRLVIGGFHIWDCVERVAKRAYERGINVLVDEDLTEFLDSRINYPSGFRKDIYPSYSPKKLEGRMFEMFMEARKGRPWLWQQY